MDVGGAGAGAAPRAWVSQHKDQADCPRYNPEVEAFLKKDFLCHQFVVGVGARKESPRAEPEAEGTEKWAKAVLWGLGRESAS